MFMVRKLGGEAVLASLGSKRVDTREVQVGLA